VRGAHGGTGIGLLAVPFPGVHVTRYRAFPAPLIALGGLLLAVITAACDNSLTGPSQFAAFSQTDLRVGTGATAVVGNTVTVHYPGWLYDATKPEQKGPVFETSLGRDPFTFVLGAGQVIQGWDQGLPGTSVGGVRRLVVPPSLAYGQTRYGIIPPNATLVFEVELLELQ
jgi:FKBP-type peptidyl-prolyl cis-trans isomerase FkpA